MSQTKRRTTVALLLIILAMGIFLGGQMHFARATANLGSWSTKAARPVSAEGLGAAAVGTTVFAVAGNSPALSENDAYDTLVNTWTPKTPLPTPVDEPAGVVSTGGLVYVIGGIQNGVGPVIGTVQVYSSTMNTWTTAASMPTPRDHSGVVAILGKIYVIGGYQFPSTTTLNVVEVYDTSTNTWTTLAPMPTAREGLFAGVVGNKIYAIGGLTVGRSGASATGIVEAYDPGTNTWSTGFAPMPTPRGIVNTMGGVFCGDTVLVVGGENGAGVLNTNEAYQPSTNTWVTHPSMLTARAEAGSAIVGNTIFVVGGFTISPGFGDTNVNEAYSLTCRAAHSTNVAYVTDFGTGVGDPTLLGSSIFVNAINGIAIPSGGTYTTASGTVTTFTNVFVDTIDSGGVGALIGYDTVMLYEVCDIGSHLNLVNALNAYLSTGLGKVVIYDADRCAGTSTPNYSAFLYPFTTNNPGPRGFLTGSITLVESESLPATLTRGISAGTNGGFPSTDAVGDSNTFSPNGQGWCSSIEGTNVNGVNGIQEGYLRTSTGGLVIYEGNDNWFTDSGTPQPNAYDKTAFDNILDQPFSPDSLPCSLPVTGIGLAPLSATNPVGGSHTVTATLTPAVAGITITFSVQSGPNAGRTANAVTGTSGLATFTYTDTGGAGTDLIVAQFTDSTGAVHTSNMVSKIWSNSGSVGGELVPLDNLALLAPYIMLAAIILGVPTVIVYSIRSRHS